MQVGGWLVVGWWLVGGWLGIDNLCGPSVAQPCLRVQVVETRLALSKSPPSWAGGAYAARGHSVTPGAQSGLWEQRSTSAATAEDSAPRQAIRKVALERDVTAFAASDVKAVLSVVAPRADDTHRAPLRLVAVLDKSGSMNGEKIRLVKQTMILGLD
eukprot:Skav208526  [mRNA]  locus=scaffold1322:287085:289373:- [translate_table: standard]